MNSLPRHARSIAVKLETSGLPLAALLVLVAASLVSCGGSGGSGVHVGGESHFLASCALGCGDLGCLEAICTRTCNSTPDCVDLDPAAVCRTTSAAPGAAGVCDVACAGDESCSGGGLACQEGYCRQPDSVAPSVPISVSPPSAAAELASSTPGSESIPAPALTAAGLPLACANSGTLAGVSIYVDSQEEVETLAGCEDIQGALAINGQFDLRPLRSLRHVSQLAFSNPAPDDPDSLVVSLEGLEQLELVDRLSFADVSFGSRGLEGLREVGQLTIRASKLTDLFAFRQLNVTFSLELDNNPLLTTLDGLAPTQLSELLLTENPALRDLGGLSELRAVGGLRLRGSGVENLDGLASLRNAGAILLSGNPQLSNIDALNDLELLGNLILDGNDRLGRLPPFPLLTSVDSLLFLSNERLDLTGSFIALREMPRPEGERTGMLRLKGSNGFRNLDSFPLLEHLLTLDVSDSDIEAVRLPKLAQSGQIVVRNNPTLARLELPELASTSGLYVQRNAELSALEVAGLSSVDYLVVALNPALTAEAAHVPQGLATEIERVGGNAGATSTSSVFGQLLDPCPWEGDGHCDACREDTEYSGCNAHLCSAESDREDCGG